MGQQAAQRTTATHTGTAQRARRRRWARELYPPAWEQIATQVKQRAGWRCERCGVAQGALVVNARGALYRAVLAACHLDHTQLSDPAAPLVALCRACHCRQDAQVRARSRSRNAVTWQRQQGQLSLLL